MAAWRNFAKIWFMGRRGVRRLRRGTEFFSETGDFFIDWADTAGRGLVLLVQSIAAMRHAWSKREEVVRQIFLCGVISLPVVTITAFFAGAVLSAQAGNELVLKLGNSDILGALVGASICREMGPVFNAVVVTGLVGGGMASVLGTMKVSEEIDALEVMSIDPVRYLVMPRLAAMLVAVPLLTIFADWVGILGGAVVAKYQVGSTFHTFFTSAADALELKDVAFGILKSVAFGTIITIVSCDQGLSTSGGAEGVGRATMRSVVYNFLLILIFNYLLFSLVYRPLMQ
ncbi:MAG TPA: ABC transporter permease [Planctomycetota bacterium]|nr:ABC transporter permease [Planctomycetota bacterium]